MSDELDEMVVDAWIESDDEPWGAASWSGAESAYHTALRGVLLPEYRNLPAEQIDAIVGGALESMSPEDAEDFGSFLSNLGRTVAPIAAKVLTVAAPIVGTLVAGPAGAAVGGAIGRFAGQAVGGVTAPPAAQPVAAAPSPPACAPPTSGIPAGAGTSAISQLLSFLENPALFRSIASQLLGGVGARTVPVGPGGLPAAFGAFMNALSVLANQAASEAEARYGDVSEAESSAYLRDESGSFIYDPAVPEDRASALMAQLRASEAQSNGSGQGDVGGWFVRAGLVS